MLERARGRGEGAAKAGVDIFEEGWSRKLRESMEKVRCRGEKAERSEGVGREVGEGEGVGYGSQKAIGTGWPFILVPYSMKRNLVVEVAPSMT